MLLSLMLIGCGNTQPVQDTEDIALTEAPMEEEQVSPEEKTFDSLVKLDEGIYMMDCYTDYLVDEYLAENITETEQLDGMVTGLFGAAICYVIIEFLSKELGKIKLRYKKKYEDK